MRRLYGLAEMDIIPDPCSIIMPIHGAGVLHRDIRMANLVWNEEKKRIMVIDFERAVIVKDCLRKRMRSYGTKMVDGKDNLMPDIKKKDPLSLMEKDISAAEVMFDPKFPEEYRC